MVKQIVGVESFGFSKPAGKIKPIDYPGVESYIIESNPDKLPNYDGLLKFQACTLKEHCLPGVGPVNTNSIVTVVAF